ncbi:MAG: type II secretion system protein GspN [Desulfobacterales bacterium]|jgi:type II secretion system protein N|nr:type II secretion system protein GspN [Desulfobacterales bacterium]
MKKWVAFTGYIIFATLIFLYYLFPTDALIGYLNYKLSDSIPGFHFTADRIRPSFPPGLKLEAPVLMRKEKELIKIDHLYVRPRYLTIFSQTKAFLFDAVLKTGSIAGTVEATLDKPALSIDLLFEQLELGAISALQEITPHGISGVLNGKLNYTHHPPYGSGRVEFVISSGVVDFKPVFFGVEQLKLDTINMNAELADQTLTIESFEVKGRELNGKATGTANLRNPLILSALNISGLVTPTPLLMKSLEEIFPISAMIENNESTGGIPFNISGTIENPGFSLR